MGVVIGSPVTGGCAVKEMFSNKIVGHSIVARMKFRLVVNALNNAGALRGSRSRKALRTVPHHGLVGLMGGVGTAGDDADMEWFFALLQARVLSRRT